MTLHPRIAESYQNAETWNIEAIQPYPNLGLNQSDAHVQPHGAYHYHGMPEGFLSKLAKGQAVTFVGFVVDGFPLYARYGYAEAMDSSSAVVAMVSSYRLKAAADPGRPAAAEVPMGTFTQDWEGVAGGGLHRPLAQRSPRRRRGTLHGLFVVWSRFGAGLFPSTFPVKSDC